MAHITYWGNLVSYLRTFSSREGYNQWQKYRILIHHLVLLINRPILIIIECFCFCLNVSSGFEIGILLSYLSCRNLRSVVDRETTTTNIIPVFGNVTEIGKSIGNKNPIKLTPISGICIEVGTTVGQFWVSLSSFLWDGWLRAFFQVISFWVLPAPHNIWMMAFCASNIYLTLVIHDTGW